MWRQTMFEVALVLAKYRFDKGIRPRPGRYHPEEGGCKRRPLSKRYFASADIGMASRAMADLRRFGHETLGTPRSRSMFQETDNTPYRTRRKARCPIGTDRHISP
eukprot:4408583-Prymnesium_polylepis.1